MIRDLVDAGRSRLSPSGSGMSHSKSLAEVLSAPTAAAVWRLRADLLESGIAPSARVLGVLGELHEFLDHLATSTSSRDYSNLASRMDISAIGGVLLENVLETQDRRELATRMLTGLVSEGLMVLATRQHVKAWEGELAAVHRAAAWYLYEELWHWTAEQKPELPAAERRRLLDLLFAPLSDRQTPGSVKAVLLGRLFQLLVVASLPRPGSA